MSKPRMNVKVTNAHNRSNLSEVQMHPFPDQQPERREPHFHTDVDQVVPVGHLIEWKEEQPVEVTIELTREEVKKIEGTLMPTSTIDKLRGAIKGVRK